MGVGVSDNLIMATVLIHHSQCVRHWSKCFLDTYVPTNFSYKEIELREVMSVDEEVLTLEPPV